MKYKANQDFINSRVGNVRKGDVLEGKLDDPLEQAMFLNIGLK